jgi:hypothetical protein
MIYFLIRFTFGLLKFIVGWLEHMTSRMGSDQRIKYFKVLDDHFSDLAIRCHHQYCCTGMDGRHRNH